MSYSEDLRKLRKAQEEGQAVDILWNAKATLRTGLGVSTWLLGYAAFGVGGGTLALAWLLLLWVSL